LGLPLKDEVAIGSDGLAVSKEIIAEEIQKYDDELAKEADVEIGDEAEGAAEEANFMEEKPAKKDKIVL
jgi:hypothetical protein